MKFTLSEHGSVQIKLINSFKKTTFCLLSCAYCLIHFEYTDFGKRQKKF